MNLKLLKGAAVFKTKKLQLEKTVSCVKFVVFVFKIERFHFHVSQ